MSVDVIEVASPGGGNEQDKVPEEPKCLPLDEVKFEDSGFNRNNTLVAQYANRIIENFPTPSERYYDIRFVSGKDRRSYFGEVGDQCIMFHSNRICLITLAPSHPILAENKTVIKVEHEFEGHQKIDRLATKPQGKSKKGGQKLQKNSPICAIICSDGSRYVITACLTSKLIEINESIVANPDLIKLRPLSSGFIAIVQPSDWKRMAEVRDGLPKLGTEQESISNELVT